jgi:restriction system protein
MDQFYHYHPDFFNLLVDTIPKLVRSKVAVLDFFKNAGVSETILGDLRRKLSQSSQSANKYELAREVLKRVNEGGEKLLRERREIVRRICEFNEFGSCWPNDRDDAFGKVARVRDLVNAKDTLTRIEEEREKERRRNIQKQEELLAQKAESQETLERLKKRLGALFTMNDPHRRGKELETLMNEIFRANHISVRESFNIYSDEDGICDEQIDGVVELDGHVYLVEVKWEASALGVEKVSRHLSRLFLRDVRGMIISASGFTTPSIRMIREALSQKIIVLGDVEEVYRVLDSNSDFKEFLRNKVNTAIVDKQPYSRFSR